MSQFEILTLFENKKILCTQFKCCLHSKLYESCDDKLNKKTSREIEVFEVSAFWLLLHAATTAATTVQDGNMTIDTTKFIRLV